MAPHFSSWALVGDMKDAPANVITTKTATLAPTRIFVREMAEDPWSEGMTEGMVGGEFSLF